MADKAAAGSSGGVGGDKKRTYRGHALRNGQAILFTCEVGRELKAAKELGIILERYAEEQHKAAAAADDMKEDGEEDRPSGTNEAGVAGSGTVRESLQQEIAELQEKKAKGAKAGMCTVETGCKGTSGISIPKDGALDPVGVCLRLLEEAEAGQSSSRGLIKLMPLERICYGGDLEGVKAHVRDLLHEKGLLPKDPDGADTAGAKQEDAKKPTYMVSLCRRNYAAHTREEIFEALGDVIQDRWKVNLKEPDHVILVEAIKGTIGFSVCPRFNALKKYNLRQLQDHARAQAKEASAKEGEEGEAPQE